MNPAKAIVGALLLGVERFQTGAIYNPGSPSFQIFPYLTYDRLRSQDPVHWSKLATSWVLTRHDDVDAVLSNSDLFTKRRSPSGSCRTLQSIPPLDLFRLRSLTDRAFTSKLIRKISLRLDEKATELLDGVIADPEIDLIKSIARPLSTAVVADFLDINSDDIERVGRWSENIVRSMEPTASFEETQDAEKSRDEMDLYLSEMVNDRRRNTGDDLVGNLIRVEKNADRLAHNEIVYVLGLMLTNGSEMTKNLIGNGFYTLASNPKETERLRGDFTLMEGAVEEVLRYESPFQVDVRMTLDQTEIRGTKVLEGQRVLCVIGAANRDPEVFQRPHEFDITRKAESHSPLGGVISQIIIDRQAKIGLTAAFKGILPRLDNVAFARKPLFRHQLVMRGLESLYIKTGN